ncbi:hypothetical protein LOTGIDRAFT_231652 [Lottia gigantea]|uniref:HTH psq-type domain-containing protein n=1 Tax=Lottia gigantea TaxID=225164 RepID=V3ZZ40_LOTGI|nr:hypothetical protein LOTGIDRAFT_231652 [Lottia gigantea]ESO96818.1 hypothetical protein LOTGIDRAFT_231652 [Lottia gigantea]
MNESAASNFINSLVRNLQVLCHSNVEFRNDIEVVGHLYLKVDRQKKFNYIVDEKVCKNDASSTMFVSNSYHSVNPSPKKKDGQGSEGSNKTNTDSSDSASVDPNRVNSKGDNRSVPSSPHHQQSGDIYRTPIKRGMRSPEVPTRKQPRMSGDMSGGTGPQSFSFSLQRDRESPHKPDRSMSQDSSSSFKDAGGSSEAVEIDLTNIKEEVIDDKSAIQASCFFNQEQQQMLGQSSVPPFPKEPGSDDMGLYPVSLHANESPNIDNLSQLASNLASGSSQGNPFSQSPQQMPQFLSELLARKPYKELTLNEKVKLIESYQAYPKPTQQDLANQFGIGSATVHRILKKKEEILIEYENSRTKQATAHDLKAKF